MIPTIETIVEDLAAGTITKQQAIAWLNQHAEDAGFDLRDTFAAAAMPVVAAGMHDTPRREGITAGQHVAEIAYAIAERMMAERRK